MTAGAGVVMALLVSSVLAAQQPRAVRPIGKLERVTTIPFGSISDVVTMPGGRVLVNDGRARRLVLLDSMLAHPIVVADTTSATASAYSRGSGSHLFRWRGDTAVLLDPSALMMYVVAPTGSIARVIAFPPPPGSRGGMLAFGRGGVPAVDPRLRLLYVNLDGVGFGEATIRVGTPVLINGKPNELAERISRRGSSSLLRVDLATRAVDTLTQIASPRNRRELKSDDQGLLISIANIYDPLPLVDEWTLLPDGTVAVVRGRDYHIDWMALDGTRTSTPKMPFAWENISDERKQALVDSAVKVWQGRFNGGSASAGRGRGAAPPGVPPLAPNIAVGPPLNDVPDYVPPFQWGEHAVRADAAGNVWIRTTSGTHAQPIYDVVDRRGQIIDRVQLPAYRVIAGFGVGVVYMAVVDAGGVVRLERAQIK